jgi:hypothetical protein
VKREGKILAAFAVAGALSLAMSGTAHAILADDEYSLTQPGAELVMPFDAETGKATFLIASNITGTSFSGAAQITTHWIFWGTNCTELADASICLTLNDTIVVDPTDFHGVGKDNAQIGPKVDLTGKKGLVTVTAYETDDACTPFGQSSSLDFQKVLKDDAIVGVFTIADTDAGYSFGNDAFALGTDDPLNPTKVIVPSGADIGRFHIQTLNPSTVDASLVVLAQLKEQSVGQVIPTPASSSQTYSTTYYDTIESPTSLPDTKVSCTVFTTIENGMIPSFVDVPSAGIIALSPTPALSSETYLFGIVGQAVGSFGASSYLKIDFGS